MFGCNASFARPHQPRTQAALEYRTPKDTAEAGGVASRLSITRLCISRAIHLPQRLPSLSISQKGETEKERERECVCVCVCVRMPQGVYV